MVFFQLVGAILEFGVGQLVRTQFGPTALGLLLLALTPLLIRLSVPVIVRTIRTHPGWWATGLTVLLLALCLQA